MPSARSDPNGLMPNILLIDDDAVILRLLELNFRLSGFAVTTSTRGEEALERAAQEPPDAVITDVTMPGLDGYEVCERMRQLPGLAAVPFLFLTARSEDTARSRAAALGSVTFVTKPFDPADLVEIVRAAIGVREA
jgi:CheY-like chemotaxis protein